MAEAIESTPSRATHHPVCCSPLIPVLGVPSVRESSLKTHVNVTDEQTAEARNHRLVLSARKDPSGGERAELGSKPRPERTKVGSGAGRAACEKIHLQGQGRCCTRSCQMYGEGEKPKSLKWRRGARDIHPVRSPFILQPGACKGPKRGGKQQKSCWQGVQAVPGEGGRDNKDHNYSWKRDVSLSKRTCLRPAPASFLHSCICVLGGSASPNTGLDAFLGDTGRLAEKEVFCPFLRFIPTAADVVPGSPGNLQLLTLGLLQSSGNIL